MTAMDNLISPWQFTLLSLAGWLNRHQQAVIDYPKEENRILKEQLEGKRLNLSDSQRRRLAVLGKALGRRVLNQIATLVTPETILGWHRKLIARRWTYSRKGPGRPQIMKVITQLVLKMATENPFWGYTSIRDRLQNLGHKVGRTTIANILCAYGLEPSPKRRKRTSWTTFLKAHWDVLAAIDFTTVDIWSSKGLVRYYILFAMDLATRSVQLAGISTNPDEAWMKQIARNLTDCVDGFLLGKRYVIMDRDGKFSPGFRSLLESTGLNVKRIPARSPNCNAHIERFMRSIKDDCLNRMIFFGEASLRRAISHYLLYYHRERNHQGLESRIINPTPEVGRVSGKVVRRDRLGGMLRFYYREAG